jgi:putative oxidoreductase
MVMKFRQLYEHAVKLHNRLQPLLLLVLRSYWGYQFFITGRGKLINIDRTTEFFATLNIPLPLLNAYMAGLTECVGGLFLLLGLASRVTAIPLIVTMLVAYGTAHTAELRGIFSNPDGFTAAPPFLFLLSTCIVLMFGPGCFSVDELLKRFVWNREASLAASARSVSPLSPLSMQGQNAKK